MSTGFSPKSAKDMLEHIQAALEDVSAALDRRDAILARPWRLVAVPRGVRLPWEVLLEIRHYRRAADRLRDALELSNLGPDNLPDELLELLISVERRLFAAPDERALPAFRARRMTLGEIESACLAAGRAFAKDVPIHGGSPPRGSEGSPPHGSGEENHRYPTSPPQQPASKLPGSSEGSP